jgi:RNA polymerase sigma-70 factor (ECF subfamily)
MGEFKKNQDFELMLALNGGDQKALVEIYNRYWSRLLSIAANTLKDQAEAEECLQDVFIDIWNRRESLKLKYSLYAYMLTSVKHAVLKQRARRHKLRMQEQGLAHEFPIFTQPADADLLEREMLDAIQSTIDNLPEKCREVYRLSREEGKNNEEISRALNISIKTVEGHMTRALKDIRLQLTSTGSAMVLLHALKEIGRF